MEQFTNDSFVMHEGLFVPAEAIHAGRLAVTDNLELVEVSTESLNGGETMSADMTNLGMLRELARQLSPDSVLPERKLSWQGSISKSKRVSGNKELAKLYEAASNLDNLEQYYVHAFSDSRVRCIDGRLLFGYLMPNGLINQELANRDLGPQIPGGTPAAALANRVVSGEFTSGIYLSKDIREVADVYKSLGINMGGHVDEHKDGHEFDTGCGAIDRMIDIIDMTTNDEILQEVEVLCKAILGDGFDSDIFDVVVGRLHRMQSIKREYYRYDEKAHDYLYKKEAIDTLIKSAEQEHHPIAKLIGDHNEMLLVINFMKGTTFNRDKFWVENDGQVQAFNYDIWESFDIASKLYPLDFTKHTSAEIDANVRSQRTYIMVRTIYALGTAMVLTDGSLDLVIRKQKNNQSSKGLLKAA